MAASGSTGAVVTALCCNFVIAIAKLVACVWTGSSAMLASAVQSLADFASQALLLLGIRRAARPADTRHAFGYAKELYFWSFVVAILMFALGAGVAIHEGVTRLHQPPRPLPDANVAYAVLAIASLLIALAVYNALADARRVAGASAELTVSPTVDPPLFVVLTEHLAAVAGALIALAGIYATDQLGLRGADAAACLAIGFLMAALAAFMSIQFKRLLVGEAAGAPLRSTLRGLLRAETGPGKPVRAINDVRTLQLGPNDVLIAASLDFKDGESAQAVEEVSARIDRAIKAAYPEVTQLYLAAQSATDFRGRATDMAPAPAATAPLADASPAAAPAKPVERRDTATVLASLGESKPHAAHSDNRKSRKKKRRH